MDSQDFVVVEFEHAKVFLVSEDGSAPKLKYPNSVKIKAEYDPEVSFLVRIMFENVLKVSQSQRAKCTSTCFFYLMASD